MRLKKIFPRTCPILLLLFMLLGCVTKQIVPDKKLKITVKVDGEAPEETTPPVSEPEKEPVIPTELEPEAPVRGPISDKDKYIVLNFDQADIQIVLQTISEILGMNYILGPKISGKITIQTYKKIPKEDIFSVLHSILEINGFTTVKTGHYYKIIQLSSAKQYPIKTVIGKDADAIPEIDIPVTQIIPLEYISANEASSVIKSLVSKHGNLITHKASGMLILTDIQSNLRRLMKIINLLDTPEQKEMQGERVFVYYVENGEADKIAKVLTQIYKTKRKTSRDTRTAPKPRTLARKVKGKKAPKKTEEKGLDLSEFEGDLKIVADTEINALIIKTSLINYESILKVLEKIDIIPRQVLIEVLIADISLTEDTKFGLRWSSVGDQKIGGYHFDVEDLSFGKAPAVTAGLNYLLKSNGLIEAQLAMEAIKGNVNILSSPYILAADNKEATIDVVDQIAIPKTTFTGGTGGTESTQQSFEYKDAGIKLKVKPKINKKGLVNMEITQEVSEPFICLVNETDSATCFKKRTATTTMVVQDGQTLVIGGLIKETASKTRTGIPFLMDIPLLGYFFGITQHKTDRTELVILITPHVIHSHEDAQQLTEEYKKKMGGFTELKERVKGIGDNPVEEL